MLLGMGVVFVFLALLVVITTFMSAIIQKYFPEPTPAASPASDSSPPDSDIPEPRILAAIEAAIKQHRKNQ